MEIIDQQLDSIKNDNEIKLEKYYNGRKLRHYIQLLEIAETICRSKNTTENAKKIAATHASHYRRMVMCIAMKPFNPDGEDEWTLQEKLYMFEISKLNKLLDPNFKV